MKKFRFKFEAVHKLREQQEKNALKVFAAEQRRFRSEIEKKNKMIGDLEKSLDRRELLSEVSTNSSSYALEESYITGTKVRIYLQDQVINRAEKTLRKSFKVYLESRRQRMMMDKLKANALQKHRKENQKIEDRALNDLYVMRARVQGLVDFNEEIEREEQHE